MTTKSLVAQSKADLQSVVPIILYLTPEEVYHKTEIGRIVPGKLGNKRNDRINCWTK